MPRWPARPQLILVDELAHTNAEGSRHAKRWQDVEELLDAGIDVWTTLNVQHIESLNDVIAQITGVVGARDAARRGSRAGRRNRAGRYHARGTDRAAAGGQGLRSRRRPSGRCRTSFRRAIWSHCASCRCGRRPAGCTAMWRRRGTSGAAAAPWLTTERLLVCVGPSPTSARIVRAAKRLAASLGAEWLAVAVEHGSRGRRLRRVAGADGAKPAAGRAAGRRDAHARRPQRGRRRARLRPQRNVTKIVVGKTAQPRWKRWLFGTVVDQLLEQGGDIDVYVVSRRRRGDATAAASAAAPPADPLARIRAWRRSSSRLCGCSAGWPMSAGPGRSQHRDDVSGRRGACGGAAGPRAGDRGGGRQRVGVRLLLRPAAPHVRRQRHRVSDHVRRDARHRPADQRI